MVPDVLHGNILAYGFSGRRRTAMLAAMEQTAAIFLAIGGRDRRAHVAIAGFTVKDTGNIFGDTTAVTFDLGGEMPFAARGQICRAQPRANIVHN